MKQIIKTLIVIFCVALVLSGCGNKTITENNSFHVYKPQNGNEPSGDVPSGDVQVDTESTPKSYDTKTYKTTHSPYSLNMEIQGDKIKLWGTLSTDVHKYLLITFERNSEEGKTTTEVVNCKFDTTVEIPSSKNEYVVEVYGGPQQYGNFESVFIDFGRIHKTSDGWQFEKSPVYDHNQPIYNETKNPDEYLGATDRIQSDAKEISSLAQSITSSAGNDYEKIKLIHDWVAANLYYDFDALRKGDHSRMDALSVLEDKRGVCEGYSNLVAALVRSVGIPCRVQGGYALGIDTTGQWSESNINTTEGNHAWNEAYVGGRWVIMDCTWDSKNKYENGSYRSEGEIGDIYFDSTLEFFSLSHKLLKD